MKKKILSLIMVSGLLVASTEGKCPKESVSFYVNQLKDKKQTKENALELIKNVTEACECKDAEACNMIGMLYTKGIVKQDSNKALEYYTKSCDLNDGRGCYRKGVTLKQLSKEEEGIKEVEKACDLKFGKACLLLGAMYSKGTPFIKRDNEKAKEYLKKGCELKEKLACETLETFK